MDIETQRGMIVALIGTCVIFTLCAITYIFMATLFPQELAHEVSYNSYGRFLKYLIASNIIKFVMLPVLLTFFINDAGELENFTRKGLIERAWLVNIIGVIIMIFSGVIMGLAMASFFTGWEPVEDPASIVGPAIRQMNVASLIQAIGFGVPLLYFMISKIQSKDKIPFIKVERISDVFGLIFSMIFLIPHFLLTISIIHVGTAGILGCFSSAMGIVWCAVYAYAIHKRELPDVPED
ncbi:MAG: hypothetical protein ACTSRA_08545 [Promethearchaeota archaeon]